MYATFAAIELVVSLMLMLWLCYGNQEETSE